MTYRARKLSPLLKHVAKKYPVITLTGPRQSGKTTLCRAVFPKKPYVSLEALDTREFAREDPRGFIAEYEDGAVIDEIQNAPELTSYMQELVDESPTPGRFILTGSQNLTLTQAVNQSLAGRTAILHLLPLSLDEIRKFDVDTGDLWELVFRGGYPRIHDQKLDARRWLSDYVATYLERDVRQLSEIGNLEAFRKFTGMAAGRTAQELNFSGLGNDVGVSHNTIRAWVSILEAGFLVFRLPAWHRNLRKQLVKSPKMHFIDSGLACYLLGIRHADDLRSHPLRGALFETWATGEIYKHRTHRGIIGGMHHFRESRGLEIDLIVESGKSLLACEMKSAATISNSFFTALNKFEQLVQTLPEPPDLEKRIMFGGADNQRRSLGKVISWNSLHKHDWLD